MENIIGTSNIGGGNTASASKLTILTPNRATSGNQDSRNNILVALDAGEIVQWIFTGAKGRAIPHHCAVARGRELVYVGHVEGYAGTPATLRISGTMGLGLLDSTYVGKNGTAKLPGSMQSTCFDQDARQGVDADDYAQSLLVRAGF